MEKAIPLCVPDNCSWDEQSGQLHKHPTATRDALKVIDTARRRLRAIKGPVCVVTVAGPCRKGKSYILSKAFDQGEVFPLGHLLDPETMGIWMWVVPEKYTDRNGQEFTVVLLDSEGINAVSAENTDDHKIFTLSVLLGSVLIYNSSGVPSRTDLEGLDFISKLTQRIRLRARQGSLSEEDRPSFRKTFPYFVWLLRDVLLTLPPECNTIKEYFLKRVFNSKLDSNERAGKVAEDILDLFKGFDAFQLPPPSYDPDAVMKINDERVKEQLNPQFMAGVQRFATFLRSKLCPKTSFNDGEYVTGEALVTMLDIYVETLNTPGAVPNVQKSWEVFIHSKCSESVTAALKCYGESMIDLQKDLPCSNEGVCQHHRKSLDECLNVFRCETEGISALSTDKYLKELMAETDKLFKQWLEENRNLTKDSCVKLLHQLKKENLDRVLAQLASGKGTSLTFENVVQAYDSIESKYTKQARGAEDVCASIFAEFQPQLKSEMQNHVQYLKQLKDYDEKITEEREVRAKEEESRKILEEQIKLIDERRVQLEKEFKLMEEKKQADEQRLREQHQQELLAQKDQYRNLMEANMEQIRIERETAASQNNNTAEIISMMGEMLKSRDKEIFQLTQTMMDIASRPPTVIEKDSGSLLSIIPETIKTVGSFFFGKGLK